METQEDLLGTTVDDATAVELKAIVKWGRWLSITGFVVVGLVAIGRLYALFRLVSENNNSHRAEEAMYEDIAALLLILLIFLPLLFLFQFCIRLRSILNGNNRYTLAEAFSKQKASLRFVAILIICLLLLALISITVIFLRSV